MSSMKGVAEDDSRGLSNTFVNGVAKKVAPDLFDCVLSCDILVSSYKTLFLKSTCFIVNLAPSTQRLGHFCLIYINLEDGKIEIFDSLSICFQDPNVVGYLQKLKQNYPYFSFDYSPYPIQHPIKSNFCSVFCLSYLSHIMKRRRSADLFGRRRRQRKTMDEFYLMFDEQDKFGRNDQISLRYLLDFILK